TGASVAYAQGGQQQQSNAGLAQAVDQLANSLSQQFAQKKALAVMGGLVTNVAEKSLTLNVGIASGVRIGDRLEIRRGGRPIGRVVIEAAQEMTSTGVYEGASPARIGDAVTTPGSPSQ